MVARPSHMSFITPCTDTSRVITVVNVRSSAYVQSALDAWLDAPPPLPGRGHPFAGDLDDGGRSSFCIAWPGREK